MIKKKLALAIGLISIKVFAAMLVITAPIQAQNFDKLKTADRVAFSKRFEKEIWPLMNRRGKDGCIGCHMPNHRSGLKLKGRADADFRFMLREGFLLVDDGGSVLELVRTKNRKERMPPGNRLAWTKKEVETLQRFMIDLDKKQQK